VAGKSGVALDFIKVGLVGDARVGKTSLINSFKGLEHSPIYEPTLIVSFDRHIIKSSKRNLSVFARSKK
jgi:GTPase SAR1 family protein